MLKETYKIKGRRSWEYKSQINGQDLLDLLDYLHNQDYMLYSEPCSDAVDWLKENVAKEFKWLWRNCPEIAWMAWLADTAWAPAASAADVCQTVLMESGGQTLEEQREEFRSWAVWYDIEIALLERYNEYKDKEAADRD